MARGRFYHDPARKHIEQYQDFSGGLNTMSSNDNIKDNELVKLENVDLGARGSLMRRKGFMSEHNDYADGKPQMIARYYRRYAPYNMLGAEGSFDGLKRKVGNDVSIGGWYAFNLVNEENAYKVDREESTELVYNGGFEHGEDGWNLNVGENKVGTSLMGKSIYAESGENVLRITLFKNHSGWANEYQSEPVKTREGERFTASVKFRRSAVSLGQPPYRVHIVASVHYANKPVERFYIQRYDVLSKWQEISGSFVMPKGATHVYFGLGMLDNDISQDTSVYFEDFKVYRQRSANLAVNGTFEDGAASGIPGNEEMGWDLDAYRTEGASSVIGQSANAYSGDYVLRITRGLTTLPTSIINEYQKEEHAVPVKEGDIIDAEVMYRAAPRLPTLGVPPYRSHIVASIHLEDGSVVRQYKGAYNTDTTWRKLTGSFVMPKGAVKVIMGLGVYDPSTKNHVSTYFDNFKYWKREQVIKNGHFEKGETGWDLDVDTIKSGDSYIGYSQVAYSGDNVLRIRRFKGHGGYYNVYQDTSRQIKVSEGEEIYAEARYRQGASTLGKPPKRVHLICSVRYKDGKTERFYINKYDANATWKKISGYFKMPKNAISARIGVGILDNETQDDVVAYFDEIYARKEIEGSSNSVLAIRSDKDDPSIKRGLGYRFDGLEQNKYYIFLVDFKSDGNGIGALAVRDERYGVYPHDNGAIMETVFLDKPTEWTTKYMKFQTYDGMDVGRAYVYNYSPIGDITTVYYDNARIYEVTADVYEKIGEDDEYTGEALGEKFPYRVGMLTNETVMETVTAIGGKFFINGKEKEVLGNPPIQSDRIMEAVNYGTSLFIASGSGLLEYNGSTIAKVTPYQPTPLETLYIGTNGLIPNYYETSDIEQSLVRVHQINFSKRYGTTNEPITISVGVRKPGNADIEYKFERRNVRDKEDYWETIRDWNRSNSTTFTTNIAGEYQFRISVRKVGEEPVLDEYTIPKYIIRPTAEDDIPIDASTIHTCNRILLHWDRLILYGDTAKQDVIYISDVFNPYYFPINNTLIFENPRRERITNITKYRNSLVVFTPSSIQALYGTNPDDYERIMLNSSIGCIADRSVKVVKNNIIFLSYEGIGLLKAVGTSESRFNVDFIDEKIKNLVGYDSDAVAYVRDNQYCIVYPRSKMQLRYYYEWGVWTLDRSESLDFTDAIVEDGKLFALGSNGRIIMDSHDYEDEGNPYDMVIGTKLYDFDEPYSPKKIRQVQIMVDSLLEDTELNVDVYVDKHYEGKKLGYTEDYEHQNEYNSDRQYWKTEIRGNENTIKKGYAFDEFNKGVETASSFARRNNAFLVISGSNGTEGLQIKDGNLVSNTGDSKDTLAILDDGSIKVFENGINDTEGIKHTFTGGNGLIINGVKKTSFENDDVFPRQAIGQRSDGSLVIITARGSNEEFSQGFYLSELADLMEQENCIEAYELGNVDTLQFFIDNNYQDIYFDGVERKTHDFLYMTSDVIDVVDSNRDSVIQSELVQLQASEADIYKVNAPGKGMTIGTMLTHQENKPLKIDGIGYVFKLKKP